MYEVMRKKLLLAIAFATGIWAYVLMFAAIPKPGMAVTPGAAPASTDDNIVALFSPSGGCTDALLEEMKKATQSIDIQIYNFTSQVIAQAVVDARNKGLRVRVVLDKSQRTDRNSAAAFLKSHGVAVFIDDQHAIAHNKVVLIDNKVILTGSFNFTKASEERNAENLLIMRDPRPKLLAGFVSNFEHHLGHSTPYVVPKETLNAER
jgi:phosphatidylserine/phosphatidylglycerophosphate/cardiolipin synthase-like enzyme